ncbi:MAG TPA: hypothetical protein VGD78_09420 [Chthoniobacterales bacterium]
MLEALSGRRIPDPERRDFEAEDAALVGALYEEFSVLLEDLGRLEAFFGQLQPVIGKALPEEEAESLRLSMLEHLPQRPLRLGEVRLRIERAMHSEALPPGAKRRPFGARHAPVPTRALQPSKSTGEEGEGPQGSQALASVGVRGEPHPKGRAKAPRSKAKGINPGGEGPALQGTFAWG